MLTFIFIRRPAGGGASVAAEEGAQAGPSTLVLRVLASLIVSRALDSRVNRLELMVWTRCATSISLRTVAERQSAGVACESAMSACGVGWRRRVTVRRQPAAAGEACLRGWQSPRCGAKRAAPAQRVRGLGWGAGVPPEWALRACTRATRGLCAGVLNCVILQNRRCVGM